MFDPREAFSPLDGSFYPDLRELLRALGRLRWDHIAELPVSFGVPELLEVARAHDWLIEEHRGGFSIHLDKPRSKQGLGHPLSQQGRRASKQAKAKASSGS